jgi:hypothetical protein
VSKKSVIVKPRKMRRPRPPRVCRAIEEEENIFFNVHFILKLIGSVRNFQFPRRHWQRVTRFHSAKIRGSSKQ